MKYVIKTEQKADVATFINNNIDDLQSFYMRKKNHLSGTLIVMRFETDKSLSELETIVGNTDNYSSDISVESSPEDVPE